MLKYIPNALTILRFILIPIIIYFIMHNNCIAAVIVLTFSGITDILDGYIARHFNLITDFGKLIDPLADKATQICILGILVMQNIIPIWILLVLLLKEVLMISGASFLYGKELVVSSRWYGKLATVLLYIAIVSSLLIPVLNYKLNLINFDQFIYYLALTATLFSLIMYIKAFYMKGYLNKKNIH